MPLIIDDLLLWVLLPIAYRYKDRAVDWAVEGIDARMGPALRKFLAGVRNPDPVQRRQEVQVATQEIATFIKQNPEAEAGLAGAGVPDLGAPDKLKALAAFTESTFVMVAYLNRPAALPGFFNGPGVVTVIDVRTRDGSKFTPPRVGASQIDFAVDTAVHLGIPRVWLLDPEGPTAEVKAGMMESQFKLLPGDAEAFETKMGAEQRVSLITQELVETRRRVTLAERARWLDMDYSGDRSAPTNVFKVSHAPDGVLLMREALTHAVATQLAENDEWGKALSVDGRSSSQTLDNSQRTDGS